ERVEPSIAPPVHLVAAIMGLGKTRAARAAVSSFLASTPDAVAVISIPNHTLSREQAEIWTRETGQVARVWLGTEQPDPEQDGKTMCHELELAKAAFDAGLSLR